MILQPVIMAGGSGTRLWPLSRELFPKQFLKLCGEHTLLQQTVLRLSHLHCLDPIFTCNEEHRFLLAEQLRQINVPHPTILLEPASRNTAPAVTLAALQAHSKEKDSILLVLSADHLIEDMHAFAEASNTAFEFAGQNKLVTFGVQPTSAETGYGYIHQGNKLAANAFEVKQFIEKPEKSVAEKFLTSDDYYWNSGMFMFRASVFLQEIEALSPDIYTSCKQAFEKSQQDMDFLRMDKKIFKTCPNNSIDYAVMEKTTQAVVVELGSKWNDIGSWSAVWDIRSKDQNGNVFTGDVVSKETSNSLVNAQHKLVTTIGVDNLVIIDTADALLVANRDDVQLVKDIVTKLKNNKRKEAVSHREVYRPWGVYDSIDEGHRYQVKRITVKPGAKLSVQMHHHRAEHWIVVKGTAKVINGDKTYLVSENQSTYIPIGQVHALENPGKIPLELIEVQSGAYLGEDDIIRFEDKYGRSKQQKAIKFDDHPIPHFENKDTESV